MIVDVHTHAFPDFLAEKAMDALSKPFGEIRAARDGRLQSLLASMTAAGIQCSFLANIATRPEQSRSILEWSRQVKSPRIIPLGSVHPASKDWQGELEAICAAGLPGIKLHPQFQGFCVDSEDAIPLYRKAAALGLFVLFHSGFDIAFPGDDRASPRRLAAVRHRVDDLTMIAAHFGGWQAWDEVVTHLAGRDVFLDTSYLHQVPERERDLVLQKHTPNRILFASDSPWLSQEAALAQVRALPLGARELQNVLGMNALSLHPSLAALDRENAPVLGPSAQSSITRADVS